MSEGPELYKAARLVNTVCAGRIFYGKIVRSAVNLKNPEIQHNFDEYTIQAESCGKEMALILKPHSPVDSKDIKKVKKEADILRILFRFGMSGRFQFTGVSDIHKHAHLKFFTKDEPKMVLSFVDVRRAGIPPFTAARKVLAYLKVKEEKDCKAKDSKNADILQLCNIVPNEVIQLSGAGYDPSGNHSDYSVFMEWLQCYSNPDMKNLIDHDGRTMWFKGEAGPLAPKGGKTRTAKRNGKHKTDNENEEHQTKKVKGEQTKKTPVKKEKKPARTRKGVKKNDNESTTSTRNLRKRKLSTTAKAKGNAKKRASSRSSVLESPHSEKVPPRAARSVKEATRTRRVSRRKTSSATI